jgi:hypothetical protein
LKQTQQQNKELQLEFQIRINEIKQEKEIEINKMLKQMKDQQQKLEEDKRKN